MGLIKTAIQFGGAYALLNAGSKSLRQTREDSTREST